MEFVRDVYDRILFAVAAAWNLIGATILIFSPDFLLARLSINDGNARLLARSLASSVTTWGIGYALVAFDKKRFRDFIWLGVISKTIFFTVYAAAFLDGRISFSAFIPAQVDLAFAILFAEFLWRTSHNSTVGYKQEYEKKNGNDGRDGIKSVRSSFIGSPASGLARLSPT